MKCTNTECKNVQYNKGLCRKHYYELTGRQMPGRYEPLEIGNYCSKGHKIEGDNVSSHEKNGRTYVSCMMCRKQSASSAAKRLNIGDSCVHGHVLVEGNVDHVKNNRGNSVIRCRECRLNRTRKYTERIRQSDEYQDMLARRREKHAEKMARLDRSHQADRQLVLEVKQSSGSYTALNYLKLGKRAQRAWEPLAEAFDNATGLCKGNPRPYIDYEDDDFPSPNRAYNLCKGCPLLVECARFAAAYKPVIGVWGGEVWLDGRVVGK